MGRLLCRQSIIKLFDMLLHAEAGEPVTPRGCSDSQLNVLAEPQQGEPPATPPGSSAADGAALVDVQYFEMPRGVLFSPMMEASPWSILVPTGQQVAAPEQRDEAAEVQQQGSSDAGHLLSVAGTANFGGGWSAAVSPPSTPAAAGGNDRSAELAGAIAGADSAAGDETGREMVTAAATDAAGFNDSGTAGSEANAAAREAAARAGARAAREAAAAAALAAALSDSDSEADDCADNVAASGDLFDHGEGYDTQAVHQEGKGAAAEGGSAAAEAASKTALRPPALAGTRTAAGADMQQEIDAAAHQEAAVDEPAVFARLRPMHSGVHGDSHLPTIYESDDNVPIDTGEDTADSEVGDDPADEEGSAPTVNWPIVWPVPGTF